MKPHEIFLAIALVSIALTFSGLFIIRFTRKKYWLILGLLMCAFGIFGIYVAANSYEFKGCLGHYTGFPDF